MRSGGQCWRGPSWSNFRSPCGRRWRYTGQWPHYWLRATPTWIGPLYRSATPRSPYSGWQTLEGWEVWKGLWGNTQGLSACIMSNTVYQIIFMCHKINKFCWQCVTILFGSFFLLFKQVHIAKNTRYNFCILIILPCKSDCEKSGKKIIAKINGYTVTLMFFLHNTLIKFK